MPPASLPHGGALLDAWGRRNRRLADRPCPTCGEVFRPLKATSRYCSRPCSWANNGGHNRKSEVWWTDQKGYIQGRVWDGDKPLRIKKHRQLAEAKIGRPLRPDEDVHHINGDKADNRPENLQVLPHGEHTRLTNAVRWGRAKAEGRT